jgi:hypothetical protein
VDINKFSEDFNLEIDPASNYFGMGGSYGLLKDYEKSDEIITHYGDRGRYFFSDWASGTSRDIGTFLFEMDFAQIFDGIIIEGLNMWTNYTDKNIFKINNQYIMDARKERIRESIIYQILYETILRIEIEK